VGLTATGLGLTTGSGTFVVDAGATDDVVGATDDVLAAATEDVVEGVFCLVVLVVATFCLVVEVVILCADVVGVGVDPQVTPETLS